MALLLTSTAISLVLLLLKIFLEEIVGEFTTSITPSLSDEITPQGDGSFLIEGSANIRDINKGLMWTLPTDGPRTLNGLIFEHLEDIPESHISVQVSGHPMEIVDLEENRIKLVKVYPNARIKINSTPIKKALNTSRPFLNLSSEFTLH